MFDRRDPPSTLRTPGSLLVRGVLPAVTSLLSLAACTSQPVTWVEAAAVVNENCVACHRADGPGPFVLTDYASAARRAGRIAEAVEEGHMPPWLPAQVGPAFQDERRLSEADRETLLRWVADGALEGDPARHPTPPTWPDGWALGEPDLVIRTDELYPVPAEGPDQFRNFVLPVPIGQARYVRAVEMRPVDPTVVHHATMRVDPTPSSRLEDARDSLPGFDDMFSRTEARPPGGFFLGWTPGRFPRENPEGMAWQLEPGTDFIVQLHLRPTGQPTRAGAQVGLYFTDERPTRFPVIVRLGGQTMDIPAGESDYLVEDDFELPVDVDALGIYPHAHYLARTMEVWAELPDGERLDLIRIPDWDFNWQDAYRYESPVRIPRGSLLRMRYVFDNSADNPRNPHDPPQRVVYGPASGDEMAEMWLQVVTPRDSDLRLLQQAMVVKDRADQVEGYRHRVALDSTDAQAQFGLGTAAQAEGNLSFAAYCYNRALSASPDFAQAYYNLGLIAEEEGDLTEAEERYRQAVAAQPEYALAWNNLGRIQATSGEVEAAAASFEEALAGDASNPEILANLGTARRDLGEVERSLELLERATELAPESPGAFFSLALTLVEAGRVDDALETLNRGLALDGSSVAPALDVAWALATHPDPERRAGPVAAGLAAQVREAVGPVARVLDVEAAGYAAAGRFDEAVRIAEEALRLARAGGEAGAGADPGTIAAHLDRYRAGRPWTR